MRVKESGKQDRRWALYGPMEARAETSSIRVALETLTRQQRLVLFLRYYADLDCRSISNVLGIRPGTVGATLHTAQARLRRAFWSRNRVKEVYVMVAHDDRVVCQALDIFVPTTSIQQRVRWQDVVAEADTSRPKTALSIIWRLWNPIRLRMALAAIGAIALVFSSPALAIERHGLFGGGGPTPTSPEFKVVSGIASGVRWNLIAFTSKRDGVCLVVETTDGQKVSQSCGAGVRGELVTSESKIQAPRRWVGFLVTSLPGTRTRLIVGPVARGVKTVTIRTAAGEDISATIIPAPGALKLNLSFYAASLAYPKQASGIAARSADGRLLEQISLSGVGIH